MEGLILSRVGMLYSFLAPRYMANGSKFCLCLRLIGIGHPAPNALYHPVPPLCGFLLLLRSFNEPNKRLFLGSFAVATLTLVECRAAVFAPCVGWILCSVHLFFSSFGFSARAQLVLIKQYSGKFALTSAAGTGGVTALPHRATCFDFGYILPSASRSIM